MLNQLISAALSPLGTSLLLGLCALAVGVAASTPQRRRVSGVVASSALVWLWLWSTPLASEALRGHIESQAGPRDLMAVPAAPALVVLGGGVSGPRPPLRLTPDLGASADRMWHAARLYHAGKAPKLLLSGGVVRTGDGSEAEAMHQFLLDLGVPSRNMWLEPGSDNTRSNAQRTADLLHAQGIHEIILVTSALHMPRARAEFESTGLKVHPAPTDFEIIDMPFDLLRIVPDTAALHGTARAFKEWLGLLMTTQRTNT